MTCIINLDGMDIDVEAHYRANGFADLPPQLTMSGFDILTLGKRPYDHELQDGRGNKIDAAQAVPVQHGDKFYAVPPAHY